MLDRIAASIETLVLGETAVIAGVRVRRGSLLGYEVAGSDELFDARQTARRIASLAKTRPVRVTVCARCGGDGLGRRNRGACGLCGGPGIQVATPPLGWSQERPQEIAAGVQQTLDALDRARHARATASLRDLLRLMLSAAPEGLRDATLDRLARSGRERDAAALAAALGTRAA